MSVRVKICGITSVEDALAAAESGADFIGVIVAIDGSPRSISLAAAERIVEKSPAPVVVLLEKSLPDIEKIAERLQPYAIQLIGAAAPGMIEKLAPRISARIWKTMQVPQRGAAGMSVSELRALITHYRAAGVAAIVLDTLVKLKDTAIKGGTGQVCDWDIAQQLAAEALVPLFLAGGIGPANVRAAITAVRPYGIDLSSGVEQTPGKKDPRKIAELMRIVRTA